MLSKTLLLGLSFSFVLMITTLCLVFLYVPTEGTMEIGQKIFYIHVPVAWVSFLAFFVVFLCSILYLWRREEKWDILACSSAEGGLVFATLALITGSIWAKPAWGAWWVWDARLASTLLLWFIYLAYFIVRFSAVDELRGARLSGIVGIVGFADVPISVLSVSLWRTQHSGPVVFKGGLSPKMLLTLLISLAAFTSLYFLLLSLRTSLMTEEREIRDIKG